MATTWIPLVPERFGQLAPNYALLISCNAGGCHGATRFDRKECVRRWGEEGKIADVLERMKCGHCGRKRVGVQIVRDSMAGRTEGDRVRAGLNAVDKIARDIIELKTSGEIS